MEESVVEADLANIIETDETLDIASDDEDDDEPQPGDLEVQVEAKDMFSLRFKEISEEWKMISWFTESICVRFEKSICNLCFFFFTTFLP